MACGCPIVASRIPSTVEVAGGCPFYFEVGSVDSLIDALEAASAESRKSQQVLRGVERAGRALRERRRHGTKPPTSTVASLTRETARPDEPIGGVDVLQRSPDAARQLACGGERLHVAPAFVQALFDYACTGVRRGRRKSLYWRLLHWLSRAAGVRDWLVTFEIDGYLLYLPLSHRLPQHRLATPGYSSNLGRLAQIVQSKYPDLTLVDVGANVGDSVAIVRRRIHCPILCVEGEERFASILGLEA